MEKSIYHYDIEQRSPEWYAIKVGKFSGSDFCTFMGKGETRNKALWEKAVERITGKSEKKPIINEHIQRGIELEDIARTYYEMETGNTVVQVGFIEMDEYTGSSPDGLVGDDGIIEIKCPCSSVFLRHLIKDDIEKQYYIQIQFNLMVSGRKWCDFIRYNENFDLYIKRVYVDEECQKEIREALKDCISEIEEIIKIYKERGKNDNAGGCN